MLVYDLLEKMANILIPFDRRVSLTSNSINILYLPFITHNKIKILLFIYYLIDGESMANQYSGPLWENNGVDFVPDFYLPQNQSHPTSPSRTADWHQIIENARSLSVFTRYTMKLTVFVLIALAGLMLDKPAVAKAPVFAQLPSGGNIHQIIENVTKAQVQEAASARSVGSTASASAELDETSSNHPSEDITFYDSPSEEHTLADSSSEESVLDATEDVTASDSIFDESEIEESTTSSSSQSDSDEVLVYQGSTGCCIWPTRGRVTSRVTRWHTAIDIAAPYWTPVVAADGGRVIAAGWDRTGYGYRMIIDHGSGLSTVYAHLARYYYDYGDYVNKGMMIGRVGSTGYSSGYHLHFEVRVNNYRQNPWNWLP